MKKIKISDEELIELIHSGDDVAFLKLMEKYRPYAKRVARDFYELYKDRGLDFDELNSIALSSINIALKKYTDDSDTFYPYWKAIVKNDILKYVEKCTFSSNEIAYQGPSLDSTILDSDISFSDSVGYIDHEMVSPIIIQEIKDLLNDRSNGLTSSERKVAFDLLNNKTADEIAKEHNYSMSKTYYLINNVRKKLINVITKHYL